MEPKKPRARPGQFNLIFGQADLERLAHLAATFGTTKSDAIRRAVELTYERQVQELMGTKIDYLVEKTQLILDRATELSADLAATKSRVNNSIEVVRGVESVLKGVAGEARSHAGTAALLLRAMVNTLKSRPDIEAEITRLLQEAQHGRLPEA
ncbi:hypothetical protein [Geothrix sp. PMB-07]|uniref:hypothetical protein n=1 Tax=Geothrix sp. PMB-07 TaxID=3068640 RepID=UPI002740AC99|nr:hypothetical protein [Geothrix sp. PMB-07]WLT30657.1 hypothetical protein Q9293_13125 [Geothrix sp. PMB-07]